MRVTFVLPFIRLTGGTRMVVEYANGLIMLFGKARMADAEKLYREAAACKPADAMERLDVEGARSELE